MLNDLQLNHFSLKSQIKKQINEKKAIPLLLPTHLPAMPGRRPENVLQYVK
jgi:hypothetical protein